MVSFIQVDDSIDISILGEIEKETMIRNKKYKIVKDVSYELYFKVRELSQKNKTKIQLVIPISVDKMYKFLLKDGKLKMHGEVITIAYS